MVIYNLSSKYTTNSEVHPKIKGKAKIIVPEKVSVLALTDIAYERAWVKSTELNLEFKHRQVISNSPAVKQHSSP